MSDTFADLKGKTLASIEGSEGDDTLTFKTTTGETYRLRHYQDCCETVLLEDVTGDLADLIGTPILEADEVSGDVPGYEGYSNDSHTWTFYKLGTIKGSVTLRWLGESNGYYSEDVSFDKVA